MVVKFKKVITMNRKHISLFLVLIVMMLGGCSPAGYELGDIDVTPEELVEGIAFTITHDSQNPNIVYLESKMPSRYTPLWIHPQGRSQDQKVTLEIAFEGTYNVTFGVQTRGGVVFGEPVTFTVDQFYAGFVDNELWTLLSGGVDKEKTWYLDLDADAVSRYFLGPLYFYGTDDSWETVTEGKTVEGDSWNWQPDYKGNSWLMAAADFGSMTFNLKGNANVTVEHKTISARGTETGLYMIDTNNHTLRMIDASPLHDAGRDGVVIDWGDIKIMSLTEDHMQLAVLRDPVLSGEGACLLVYNFISKDYYDNWVPGEVAEPEPTLPDNWMNDVSQTVNKTIVWKLSEENPLDWANLDGSRMNGWNTPADYPAWLGTPDPAVYGNFSLTLNSEDFAATFKLPDGTETSTTYSLNEKGFYSFVAAVPQFSVIGWASFHADANNQLRILSIEKDAAGNVSGMWLGARDPDKPEYMAFHLIPSADGSATDPMTVWKRALAGKTFMPDVNYFADWVTKTWTGGWSASVFPDDFTSQSWFWTQAVHDACLASSITYYMEGDGMKADAVDNGVEKKGITVNIDTENNTITYSEAPFTFSWIYTNNKEGKGPWLFGSYNGASLSTVNTSGIYLGFVSGNDEITMNHMVLKP